MAIVSFQPADGPTYIVESDRSYPLSRGWRRRLANDGRMNSWPSAFVWDDLILRPRQGGGRYPVRFAWPAPDALLYPQTSHAGRCAVRVDLLDELTRGGVIARRDDTSAALAQLARVSPASIRHAPDVFRFTGHLDSACYAAANPPKPPGRCSSVSVVINYRDRPELMESCLAALASQCVTASVELLLIDNQSNAESRRMVEAMAATLLPREFRVRHVEYDAPFNKSIQDMLGASLAGGEVVVLFNNDARLLDPDALQTVSDWAMAPGVLSAGPRILGRDNRLVSAGVHTFVQGARTVFRENDVPALSRTVHYTAGISFACAAISKSSWERIGGLDVDTFPGQYNDADFDIRGLNAGLKHVHVGHVSCYHEPGRSEVRTKEAVRRLHDQLIARYPDVSRYSGLDPHLAELRQHVPVEGIRGLLQLSTIVAAGHARDLARRVKRRLAR